MFFSTEGFQDDKLLFYQCKRARSRSSLVDLLLGRLGIELRGLDVAVVEVALDLVDGHTLAQHLRRSPMAEIIGMDMRQAQVPGGLLDHPPGGVDGGPFVI